MRSGVERRSDKRLVAALIIAHSYVLHLVKEMLNTAFDTATEA